MKIELISRQPEQVKGPPLLFVHGAWHAAWCWDEYFLSYFAAAGYPSYALSLRGHGASEGKVSNSGIPEFIEDIRQAAGEISQPPVIIGHSMGGYVVLKYIETHPVAGAVLMAAMSPLAVPDKVRKYGRPAFKLGNLALRRALMPIPRNPKMIKKMLFSPEMPEEQVAGYARRMRSESLAFFFDYLLMAPPDPEKLNRIPLLIQRPTRDAMKERLCNQAVARLYGGRYREYPDTSHDMMLEPNWPEIAGNILDWLAELPQVTPSASLK